ncbi:MAG TPA: rhodanese-like domain-containing protein [Luteimonas sp.]|nr:rhodanese-like domain-containing protein [Luteimonas sp.]
MIGTQALAQLLKDPASKALLFHVYGAPEHLPGAIQAAPAGQGGGFDDDVQRGFGAFLEQTTGGSDTRPLVFYCQGVQCWMSYNAALRAIRMGQRNVLWYRGGLEAWTLAGLPTQGGSADDGAGAAR